MPQASEITTAPTSAPLNSADEVTALRPFYERWLESHDGRTAVGLCGVPQRRFRGVIRFLEAYANGEDTDFAERPEGVPVPRFIRYCSDDLKAFFYEARMTQRPEAVETDLHRWFWGDTAVGKLLTTIAENMNATEDPVLKNAAYGIAR